MDRKFIVWEEEGRRVHRRKVPIRNDRVPHHVHIIMHAVGIDSYERTLKFLNSYKQSVPATSQCNLHRCWHQSREIKWYKDRHHQGTIDPSIYTNLPPCSSRVEFTTSLINFWAPSSESMLPMASFILKSRESTCLVHLADCLP